MLVIDQIRQPVENLRIVAAIIFQRREILIDDLIVIRKCVDWN